MHRIMASSCEDSSSEVFRKYYSQIFDVIKKSKNTRERLCTRLYSNGIITETFLEDIKEKNSSDSAECSFMITSRLSAVAKQPDGSKYATVLRLMEEEEELREIVWKMAGTKGDGNAVTSSTSLYVGQ